MRPIVTNIIQTVNNWIMDGDYESIMEDLNSVELPVWDEMSNEEKLATLSYIYENLNDEDFTHSGCCTADCQAAAAFCVEFFRQQDLLEYLFDDLDFMMDEGVRTNPAIQKLMGINPNF